MVACGLLPCEEIEPASDLAERCASAFGADAQQVRGTYEAGGGATRAAGTELARTGSIVDALYLLGTFGVTHRAGGTPVLAKQPARLQWEALAAGAGGYPCFAGTLRLRRTVVLPAGPPSERATRLRLPDRDLMFAGVAELAVNGHALGVRAGAPYAWDAPAGVLKPGANAVTLSITTTLMGLFEGRRYNGRRYNPQTREAVPLVEPPPPN